MLVDIFFGRVLVVTTTPCMQWISVRWLPKTVFLTMSIVNLINEKPRMNMYVCVLCVYVHQWIMTLHEDEVLRFACVRDSAFDSLLVWRCTSCV